MSMQLLSNEDFASASIWPGGRGIIKDFKYRLWDYGGRMPENSFVAMYCQLEPEDGSNDGKPVDIYWNISEAKNYVPAKDGAFLGKNSPDARDEISDSCNWAQVYKAFQDNCGLKKGVLNGENGVKAMIGSRVTFSRVPQKERADMPQNVPSNAPGGQGQQPRRQNTILIPTMATFAWEGAVATKANAAAASASAPAPAAVNGNGHATATAHGDKLSAAIADVLNENNSEVSFSDLSKLVNDKLNAAAASASAPAPAAAVNGNGHAAATAHGDKLSAAIAEVLNENNSEVSFTDLGKLVSDKLMVMGIKGKEKSLAVKSLADEAAVASLATANGWTFDSVDGMLYA